MNVAIIISVVALSMIVGLWIAFHVLFHVLSHRIKEMRDEIIGFQKEVKKEFMLQEGETENLSRSVYAHFEGICSYLNVTPEYKPEYKKESLYGFKLVEHQTKDSEE